MLQYLSKLKKPKADKEAKTDTATKPQDAQNGHSKDAHDAAQHDKDFDIFPGAQDHHGGNPVLEPEDESFLERILNSDEGPAPPLPPRVSHIDWSDSDEASLSDVKPDEKDKDVKGKKKEEVKEDKKDKKSNRISQFFTTRKKASDGLEPEEGVPAKEAEREKNDLGRVLDRLNLGAMNNKVVSLSNDSTVLLQRFNQVFKDLVNGVPTAYDDLTALIEDKDGTIARGFDKLPNSLKKLVTQLPDKLTKTLAPEILLAAAEAQGIKTSSEAGMKGAAKKMFMPQNIVELVTKPGALVGMLRAIVEALKARWPAFIGLNVLWSVALSLLLFMLWYCYKRGREVRLEQEKADAEAGIDIDDSERIEELPDDPTLPAPHPETTRFAEGRRSPDSAAVSPLSEESRSPIHADAPAASSRH